MRAPLFGPLGHSALDAEHLRRDDQSAFPGSLRAGDLAALGDAVGGTVGDAGADARATDVFEIQAEVEADLDGHVDAVVALHVDLAGWRGDRS